MIFDEPTSDGLAFRWQLVPLPNPARFVRIQIMHTLTTIILVSATAIVSVRPTSAQPASIGAPIQAVRLAEIRNAITNRVIPNVNVSCPAWSDDPIIPGVTPVRAVHITEIRACLDRVLGTDRTAHVTVLRALLEESSTNYYRVKGTLMNDGTRDLDGFSKIVAKFHDANNLLLAEETDFIALTEGAFHASTQRTFDILVERSDVSGWDYFTLTVFDDDRNLVPCSGCATRRR